MRRRKLVDLTGQRFDRWLVRERIPTPRNDAMWLCICDCGNGAIISSWSLHDGQSRSCGCAKFVSYTAKEYGVWVNMLDRCDNSNGKSYHRYGGRGITVCARWRESCENFYEDVGRKPSDEFTLDRIDVNGNYEPSNCRWATKTQQANNREENHIVEIDGQKMTVMEAYARYMPNFTAANAYKRLEAGWPAKAAFTLPKHTRMPKIF